MVFFIQCLLFTVSLSKVLVIWGQLWFWSRYSSCGIHRRSKCLCHSPHFFPHVGILSSHSIIKKKGEYRTIRCFERERDHIHVTFVKVHYYSSILLLVTIGYLFLCLICNKLFMGVYVLEKG